MSEYTRTEEEEDEWGLTDFSEGPNAGELNTIAEDGEDGAKDVDVVNKDDVAAPESAGDVSEAK